MAVITFSRQYGSGGDEIAVRVCEALDYRYFDKQMMVEAAASAGLCDAEVVDFSEDQYKVQDFIAKLFRSGPRLVKEIRTREEHHGPIATLTARELNEADCVALVRYSIGRAYSEGNMVIVGRGGQAVLQNKPGVLHVRVVAPMEQRIQRLREAGMTGIADIKQAIADKDRASAEYLKRFFNIQWDDPVHYHLVINTGLLSVDAAVEAIVAAVRAMQPAVAG